MSENSERPDELLGEFTVVSTADPGEARDIMFRRFGIESTLPRSDDFFTTINIAELPNLFLHYGRTTGRIDSTVPKHSCTSVVLCLRGSVSITTNAQTVTITEGQASACSPGYYRQMTCEANSETLMLRIPQGMLERAFAPLTGFKPKCGIVFEPLLDEKLPAFRGFVELLMMLASRLDRNFSAWPPATLEQLELACVTSLLFCSRHNLRHLLDDAAEADAPRHVRVAEHFAEVNATRDIAVDEMARAAAVSVSTLTRAFLRHRGCTPAAYIKRSRLNQAKTLLENRIATTVVGVALRCGFTNPSRFGKDYQQAFGETPTQTLRRLRQQPGA